MNRPSIFIGIALVASLVASLAGAQPPEDKPLEQTKKNIKVLNGVPSSQLIPLMTVIANSLGVTCTYCHESAWESDAKPPKEAARRMIRLTRAINDTHYAGKVVVGCQTCHHGAVATSDTPRVSDAGWNQPSDAHAPVALPTAEEAFARFLAALGNDEAMKKLENRLLRGMATATSGRGDPRSAPFELFLQRPEKAELNTEAKYPPEGNRELGWQFLKPDSLRQRYGAVETIGAEDVRGREAWIVRASPSDGSRAERLSFDIATGLLVRREHEVPTLLGVLPAQYDFDDYRSVDGVLVPFVVQWSRGDYQVTHRLADVRHNVTR